MYDFEDKHQHPSSTAPSLPPVMVHIFMSQANNDEIAKTCSEDRWQPSAFSHPAVLTTQTLVLFPALSTSFVPDYCSATALLKVRQQQGLIEIDMEMWTHFNQS